MFLVFVRFSYSLFILHQSVLHFRLPFVFLSTIGGSPFIAFPSRFMVFHSLFIVSSAVWEQFFRFLFLHFQKANFPRIFFTLRIFPPGFPESCSVSAGKLPPRAIANAGLCLWNRCLYPLVICFFGTKKIGSRIINTSNEKASPLMVPKARLNQKSEGFPIRNGIKPNIVEAIVKTIGMILAL